MEPLGKHGKQFLKTHVAPSLDVDFGRTSRKDSRPESMGSQTTCGGGRTDSKGVCSSSSRGVVRRGGGVTDKVKRRCSEWGNRFGLWTLRRS